MIKNKVFSLLPSGAVVATCLFVSGTPHAQDVAATALTANQIAANIYARDEGKAVSRELAMELIDRRGKVRRRAAMVYRRTLEGVKQKAIFFTGPRRVKDMAFLTHDFTASDKQDQQWLYLPAMRKVRRIPASDRGDYFLGTDFTYNDVKDELKFEPAEYEFSLLGQTQADGKTLYQLEGRALDTEIADELGYSAFKALVDAESWIPFEIDFLDREDQVFKHVEVTALDKLEGIWTPLAIEAENLRTGHKTVFTYSNVSFSAEIDEKLFSARALKAGSGR